MYRVDRFGYSSRLRGGDDYASMAAGNTSVFNCRDVVNRPGVRSPHSYGRALDVNTWENPYRSARGIGAQLLVAVALPPPGGLALRVARASSRIMARQRPALDLRHSATPSTSTRRPAAAGTP